MMLGWALLFFVVAIVSAVFGFGGIAAGAAGLAKLMFFVFLILFSWTMLAYLAGGQSCPDRGE